MSEKLNIQIETLRLVLSKAFSKNIVNATYKAKQLCGGTLGEVQLVSGFAETVDGEKVPYKVVWKTQKKMGALWRPGFVAQRI